MTATCTTYYRHTDLNATSGALTHRYYVRDYLGSTRAVIDEEGNVLQSTAYYPSGVPYRKCKIESDSPINTYMRIVYPMY